MTGTSAHGAPYSTATTTTSSTSVRTVTATRALRRIKRVIELQWRGIFIVIIILADVIYFSTVFLQFDGTTQRTDANLRHGFAWLLCVLSHDGDKNKCLTEAADMVVKEVTAFSVLFLLSVAPPPPPPQVRKTIPGSLTRGSSTASGPSCCWAASASIRPGDS